jgi:hypothetical protein
MPIEYTIDIDQLTFRDIIAFQKVQSNQDLEAVLPILEKCVIVSDGRSLQDLPFRHFNAICAAVLEKVQSADVDDLGNSARRSLPTSGRKAPRRSNT